MYGSPFPKINPNVRYKTAIERAGFDFNNTNNANNNNNKRIFNNSNNKSIRTIGSRSVSNSPIHDSYNNIKLNNKTAPATQRATEVSNALSNDKYRVPNSLDPSNGSSDKFNFENLDNYNNKNLNSELNDITNPIEKSFMMLTQNNTALSLANEMDSAINSKSVTHSIDNYENPYASGQNESKNYNGYSNDHETNDNMDSQTTGHTNNFTSHNPYEQNSITSTHEQVNPYEQENTYETINPYTNINPYDNKESALSNTSNNNHDDNNNNTSNHDSINLEPHQNLHISLPPLDTTGTGILTNFSTEDNGIDSNIEPYSTNNLHITEKNNNNGNNVDEEVPPNLVKHSMSSTIESDDLLSPKSSNNTHFIRTDTISDNDKRSSENKPAETNIPGITNSESEVMGNNIDESVIPKIVIRDPIEDKKGENDNHNSVDTTDDNRKLPSNAVTGTNPQVEQLIAQLDDLSFSRNEKLSNFRSKENSARNSNNYQHNTSIRGSFESPTQADQIFFKSDLGSLSINSQTDITNSKMKKSSAYLSGFPRDTIFNKPILNTNSIYQPKVPDNLMERIEETNNSISLPTMNINDIDTESDMVNEAKSEIQDQEHEPIQQREVEFGSPEHESKQSTPLDSPADDLNHSSIIDDEKNNSCTSQTPTFYMQKNLVDESNPNMPFDSNTNFYTDSTTQLPAIIEPEPSVKYPPGEGPCRTCGLAIEGKRIFSKNDNELSGQWHRKCFHCIQCQVIFNKKTPCYILNDNPYCQQHYHEANGSICLICHKFIEGECLENDKKERFHVDCLTCFLCKQLITDDYFIFNGEIPLCTNHDMEQLLQDGLTVSNNSLSPNRENTLAKRRTRIINFNDNYM